MTERLLLRADITHNGRSFVAHTLSVSEDSAFVRTDEVAYNGDRVEVSLSFPGLVDPFVLESHVVAQRLSAEPGEGGGWTLAFVFYRDDQRDKFLELLAWASASDGSSAPDVGVTERYRVLLVDDSQLAREVFSHRVDRYFRGRAPALHLQVAADAESAWELLEDDGYDLAIIDYFLPSASGAELIGRLREEPRLSTMPIIAMSIGGKPARDATLAAGADLFLDKPVALGDLFATLDRLTRRRAAG